ncbi:OmpA family protein [Novosphingobium sediminicola]|uniref:Outer membrane protein OmpA-like peptidoglycan-associated protein n=1 Tax=Novosphingobium sediminicola TaxID=563162 RepID=A0A7W6CGH8_9SPHN|nr:OmpA family protein [Novosphingobium sediminicola]MBB3955427.1 outer membrane protein OmpA-like peptidoglycan-associated protein [Novosphingobium sediminicola]
MRNLVLAAALASSALATTIATTAHAETGPYVTVEGGAVQHERIDIRDGSGNFQRNNRAKLGWQAGGAVGYDFGNFRLEAEGFYDKTALRSEYRPNGTPLPNGYFNNGNGFYGHTETTAGMVNALFSVGKWGMFKAYAGAGAGYARVDVWADNGTVGGLRGHDEGFAWQALAGISAPLSKNVDLGIKYRYFRPEDAKHFADRDGAFQGAKVRSHAVLATLTYNFGRAAEPAPEPAPPPPPPPPVAEAPPPPPPPPPPPAPVCNKGPYIVFFDWDKSELTSEAASILDSAVQAYGNCASVPVMVAGYTDSSGTPKYNLGLSARRADSVKSYLTSHGIGSASITTQGLGEANQRVPTADGVRELQNRRVEITYGPGAGN